MNASVDRTAEILVVEDSATQAEQLRRNLEEGGYRVRVAADARQALRELRERTAHVVISDIVMPGMDGYQLCRAIKDDPCLGGIPVILLTSLADTEDVVLGLECAADNFITKPYDVDYLLSRVQSVLTNRALYTRDHAQLGLEIRFGGRTHFINSDRLQILNLLISTYENAIRINRDLIEARDTLRRLNADLEHRVEERTKALTAEIAEHRQAEIALRESELRYREFFESDLTAAFVCDRDGLILDGNPAFVRLFGFADREAALGTDAAALWADPAERAAALARLEPGRAADYREERCRRVDGRPLLVIGNAYGIFDDAGRLAQTREYLYDITDRKRMEGILVQAQKMEAVGRLAGGIAHDFNNMLMVIQGFTDILGRPSSKPETRERALGEIRKATERAAALTQQLLAFSRKQVFQLETVALNGLVEDTAAMIRRLIGEDIACTLELAPESPCVRADRGQVVQVLMNLVVNARDAMPRGGRLTIRTAVEDLGEEQRQDRPYVRPGRYVLLQVADTGAGMDAETMSHLFEPFYTTKEKGKGTGLGLATVYGIVKQSDGFIWATSEPGRGATFSVYLPAVAEAGGCPDAAEAASSTTTGTERILLVEDEEKVREILAEILAGAGYRVLTAADGDAALAAAAREEGLDLVVTDVVMPGIRGTELADELRRRRPGTKVLFMSGYLDGSAGEFSHRMTGERFLQKPIGPRELLAAVRAALEECR